MKQFLLALSSHLETLKFSLINFCYQVAVGIKLPIDFYPKPYPEIDFKNFLERYEYVNSNLQRKVSESNGSRLRFMDMPLTREDLDDDEVIPYATLLYSMNLFFQVVFGYYHATGKWVGANANEFRSNIEKSNSGKDSRLFPEIFGVLSTANAHVCPGVPALIVIYCKHADWNAESQPWNRVLERHVWEEHLTELNESVSWVAENAKDLLQKLGYKLPSHEVLTDIRDKFLNEHNTIKIEIHKEPRESRRVTNF
jgi:hypothetical protein